MKIVILSDIHDNIWNLNAALARLTQADALICCGDLCSPFVVNLLADGFRDRPIHIVFGNNDGDSYRIMKNASRFSYVHMDGEFFQSELGGKRFGVTHFNDIGLGLARSGQFDVVCFGHNHCFQIERVKNTLSINPGTLMGYDPINVKEVPPTLMIYDTKSDTASGYQLAGALAHTGETSKLIPYP
jgi:putative phosphoesterase